MAKYRRVTYEDRCQIHALLQAKISISNIASETGFDKSTIYRELARNTGRKNPRYRPKHAHYLAQCRFVHCRKPQAVSGDMEGMVLWFLFNGLSPEQISARLKKERLLSPSFQSIYRWIGSSKKRLRPMLRRYRRYGGGRTIMRRYRRNQGETSIFLRPKVANQRKRLGDWERDMFMVAGRKQVLVCTDRKSRYTKLSVSETFNASAVSRLTLRLLKETGGPIHTITNDNGTEFRGGAKMPVPVYYCSPRRPQQRGTVENTIGLLRQYFKRNTPIEEVREYLKDVETALNLRPRKCLDFKTPYEVFFKKSVALAS